MKKTYATTMPNHIGAFLQASRTFADLGLNITRVSYNTAVDAHMLFIDAEGTEEQLQKADEALSAIGYLQKAQDGPQVLLVEFCIKDEPGCVTDVLEMVQNFGFNISYISSQSNSTGYQLCKLGLFVQEPQDASRFLAEAEKLCPVRVIDYNRSEKVFDNSIFYRSFVSGLSEALDVTDEEKNTLLINANLAMQTLDERGLSPYRVFDTIGRFAEMLAYCRGAAFSARITRHELTDKTSVTVIEPPCGSNTLILQNGNDMLFIDSGYACYEQEMLSIIRSILPNWDAMNKTILITHADLDHCGLLHLFDTVLCSQRSADSLRLEYEGRPTFREKNHLHNPYIQICKTLTRYRPVDPAKVQPLWGKPDALTQPLESVGFFDFADLHFEVYEGMGGHLPGELVLIDYEHHVAVTGDVYVNIHGMTSEQRQYNRYAPILMTSVDSDAQLCARERNAIFQRLGAGAWKVLGAHGACKDYEVNVK